MSNFSRSVQGLRSSDTPKLPFPIDLLCRPYNSVRTNMLHCDNLFSQGRGWGYKRPITAKRGPLTIISRTREQNRGLVQSRIVNLWNSLPENVVSPNTVNTFKNRLDKCWSDQELMYDYEVSGLFIPRYFRCSEQKFPVRTFTPRKKGSS